jgi:hypothetical protein
MSALLRGKDFAFVELKIKFVEFQNASPPSRVRF